MMYRALSHLVARWQLWRYRRKGTVYYSVEEIREVLLGNGEDA